MRGQIRIPLARLMQTTARLGRDSWLASPGVLLPVIDGHLAQVMRLASAVPGHRRELLAIASESATLAGRLSCFRDNRSQASTYLGLALSLARDLGDSGLRATALTQIRNLYSPVLSGGDRGDSKLALEALNEAERAAGPLAAPILRTWIFTLRAEEHAFAGEPAAAYRDLEAADRAFARVKSLKGFFEHLTPSRRARFRGEIAVLLGEFQVGIMILEETKRQTPSELAIPHASVNANLAVAYARTGALSQATAALHAALDIAESVGLIAGGYSQVAGVRQRYLPDNTPGLQALDHRIKPVLM
jgi:hypothetical protein